MLVFKSGLYFLVPPRPVQQAPAHPLPHPATAPPPAPQSAAAQAPTGSHPRPTLAARPALLELTGTAQEPLAQRAFQANSKDSQEPLPARNARSARRPTREALFATRPKPVKQATTWIPPAKPVQQGLTGQPLEPQP